MKVNVELLGMPLFTRKIGKKRFSLDFEGHTIAELINELVNRYGSEARKALLDESGKLDMTVQVLLNGEEWVMHKELKRPLKEGDTVSLMLFVAGG